MSALPSEDRTALPATLLDDVAGAPTRLDAPPRANTGRTALPTGSDAIGADAESDSTYAVTKAEGEQAVRQAFPPAVILRPSIIFGP